MSSTRPALTVLRASSSLALGFALFAAGCSLLRGPTTVPTTFYVLSATDEPGQVPAGRELTLGLGPIHLPPYLERPQMVRRVAPNELVFDEFNRWSEPLKENFVRVLANDLDRLLGVERMIGYPWYSNTPMLAGRCTMWKNLPNGIDSNQPTTVAWWSSEMNQ